MYIKTIQEAHFARNTRVLIRADLDISLIQGKAADIFRIQETVPTLKLLLRKGVHLRIITKLGRPRGKFVRSLSTKVLIPYLKKFLDRRVVFVKNPLSKEIFKQYNNSPEVLLFENIRFWPGEEKGSRRFAAKLAKWGDVYVNEAFATSHRNDASHAPLAELLPAYAGLHLANEIHFLEKLLENPQHPFIAVLGGIKLETKLPLVRKFLMSADQIILGGAVANSFLHAKGFPTGKSFIESILGGLVRHKKILLPVDVVAAKSPASSHASRIKPISAVRKDEYIVDMGPESIRNMISAVKKAKTIVWNGPLGYTPYFPKSTVALASTLAQCRAFTVVGGGHTVAALAQENFPLKRFSHVSTGGGAMLEFLAGKKLPGIEALKIKN